MTARSPATDGPLTYRAVLTSRNVPQLLLAASASRLAGTMLLYVIVLYVIDEFDSASLAGLSGLFLSLPGVVVSPLAGAVLDRMGTVRAVAFDMVCGAMLIAAVAVLSWAGALTAPLLFAILALCSLTSPLSTGGIRTLFPRFVPESAYDKANALDLSTFSVIDVAAPLAAGVLFALIGPNPTMLCVAGAFALAALSLGLLRGGSPAPPAGDPRLLRSAVEGIGYLLRNATLRGLAVAYSIYQVASGMLVIIAPVAVLAWLDEGVAASASASVSASADRYTGVMWAVAGLFGALGALVAGKLIHAGVERRYMLGATLITAVAIFPLSALGSLVTLGIGLAVVGLMEGSINVSLLSLRQRRTDPGWLGRVMTVSISVNLSGFPIGTALGGYLASRSLTAAFAVAMAVTLLSAVCVRVLIPASAGSQERSGEPG
ncbi:MFS transporter [Streptomyces sp. 6N223]|uniref:MFS transporter n=1 Tax=Streptomyces sp. 6N223 TaxID=3457412 RepID=UPI003FD66909